MAEQIEEIRNGSNTSHEKATHTTIFHDMLNSSLPEAEKRTPRLRDEGATVVSAGTVTTAYVLLPACPCRSCAFIIPFRIPVSKAFAGRSPSEGKAPSAGLDPKWVRMCEGVRKNDQAALEELFRLVKRMSWPPRLEYPAAGSQSADN